MAGRVRGNRLALALCAAGFAACNTYDAGLLIGTLNPNLPAATAGSSGNSPIAGGGGLASSGAGAVPNGGAIDEGAGAGGAVDGGDAGEAPGGYGGTVAGGASGGAGAAGSIISAGASGGIASAGAPSGSFELIDDFEDQDAFVIPVHGRNGPWYTFSDSTAGGTLGPFTSVALTGADAHDDSTTAARFTAKNFTSWGAGMGADLVNEAGIKVPYDVSAYKGVHFYAKVGVGASTALKLLIPTIYSDPSGGICSDALPYTVPSKRCSDHLSASKTLKTTWATYDIYFADLTQQSFGLIQKTLDPTSVYSLQFTMPASPKAVDLWLDDVSFIIK